MIYSFYLEPIVCPTSKLHLTVLVIKREPGNVNRTGGFKDARRNIGAQASACHHHVGGVGGVKGLTCADTKSFKSLKF